MLSEPEYRIGTWDFEREEFTPQAGVPDVVPRSGLRAAIRELRKLGYTVHRLRDSDGGHRDSDASVLIERVE